MNLAKDFRKKARNALSGRWALAVGTGFMASLLGAYTASNEAISFNSNIDSIPDKLEGYISNEAYLVIVMIIFVLLLGQLLVDLVQLIVCGPISLGYAKFNLNLIDGNNPKFGDLFSQFHRWGAGFVLLFLRELYTFLWTMLFVIPGIIAAYSYAMAPYIMYENPGMSASEALAESKRLMDGEKLNLFWLKLSFIGWGILCFLTLGIGSLWLCPYRQASYAAFYRNIKWKANRYANELKGLSEDNPYGSF